MDPFTMMMIGSSAVGAVGQIAAGQAQKQASELNAFQIETDKEMNKVQALQASRARREEYDLATSTNVAAFSAAGRDVGTDRSVEAFLERQKEVIAQDVGRIDQQTQFENMKASMAAMAERRRGRNALSAAMFSAVGTASEGIYRYQTTRK
jgi:hypothetical protein